MIRVRILGIADKKLRASFRAAIDFFIKQLMPRKRRLDIIVRFDPKLLLDSNMSGSCLAEDEAVNRRHYEFVIHIDDTMSIQDKLSILAHELTHVRQYSSGQLLYDQRDPSVSIWDGVRFHDDDLEYDDQPWEIDAVENEIRLYKELLAKYPDYAKFE